MSKLIKLGKQHWIDTDKLDFESYKKLFPKGNEKHFEDLTGKKVIVKPKVEKPTTKKETKKDK